jgi:hypothetical protein
MRATSQRLLDRGETCVAVYLRLLSHLMASGRITGAAAEGCSQRRTHHSHDEREQHDSHRWDSLVHSTPNYNISHKEAQKETQTSSLRHSPKHRTKLIGRYNSRGAWQTFVHDAREDARLQIPVEHRRVRWIKSPLGHAFFSILCLFVARLSA